PHWETMTQPPNEIFRCFRHAVYMADVMSDERLRRCDCVQQVFRFGANMLRWSIPGIEIIDCGCVLPSEPCRIELGSTKPIAKASMMLCLRKEMHQLGLSPPNQLQS